MLQLLKKDIHPKYYDNAKVSCACGNAFTAGSTTPEIKTELCSACHPFYTGKQKLVDTARRVEKFHAKMEAKSSKPLAKSKRVKREAKAKVKAAKNPKVSK